jgi:hypothetical protein
MEFTIPCECGTHTKVSEGSTGATLTCTCGRAISVPSLSTLRTTQAGLAPVDLGPELVIQQMLTLKLLPGTKACVGCGNATDRIVEVFTACERKYRTDTGNRWWLTVLLFLVFSPIANVIFFTRRETHEFGREISFVLPLPVCDNCQQTLSDRKQLKKCMEQVPEYGRLLQKFPDAVTSIIRL